MKNLFYLGMLVLVFSGCSVDSLESNEELITADAKPNTEVVNDVEESFNYDPLCAGEESGFCFTFPQASAGPNDKDTKVQIQLYTYGEDENSTEDDGYEQIFKGEGGTEVCGNWSFEEPGTYDVRYKIGSGGFTDIDVVVENCGCEESFYYSENGDKEYTFFYTPEEYMEDALLVFTFAQSNVTEGLDGWVSKGETMQNTLHLEKCVEYEWTVTLEPKCSGNSPSSNVWTNFTVNDVSKKNENTPNLTQNCN